MLAILTTHPIQYQVPLWQALARDGRVPFEVWYLTAHGIQPSPDREFGQTFAWDIDSLSGYPYRFLDAANGSTPSAFWKCRLGERLRERLRESRAIALWMQGWQVAAYWQAIREARAAGVELWVRGESNDLAVPPSWKRSLKHIPISWLLRQVDRFLYIGRANRRFYEGYGVVGQRLYAAPYAVDNDRFARQAEALRPQREEIRRKWRIAKGSFCILFCGKFIAKKRPMDLVAAAQELRERGLPPNSHLLFAGSGVLGPEIRRSCHVVFDSDSPVELAARSSADDRITKARPPASFTGFLNQTEISQAYVAADCLVLPSDSGETWGLVVNEALASGLPCLVSDACGCAEELAGSVRSFGLANIPMLVSKLVDLHRQGGACFSPPAISESVFSIVRAYSDALESAQHDVALHDASSPPTHNDI